jgi:toxin YoeB
MAKKKVIWSIRAQQDRLEILEYWNSRNQSSEYSEKLFGLFKLAAALISEHPEIGKQTDIAGIRIKLVRNYLMIYQTKAKQIDILLIWDSKRDPKELSRLIKRENR